MSEDKVIHWCNWSQQPEVRFACGPSFYYWKVQVDVPPGVHALDRGRGEIVYYTFDPDLATCPDCKMLQ